MHTDTAAIDPYPSLNNVHDIRMLVASDLDAMNALIQQQLNSNIPLIETIAQYIIESGGKQIRPLLTLLIAKAFHYQGQAHYQLSTIIEFVHTATLLHDDVVDASQLRRGKAAAHEIWGNQASVLVGDFLYSRAFQILTQCSHPEVFSVLANATNALVEGEMNQLVNRHNVHLSETDYLQIIQGKTASLFAAASEIGAVLANTTVNQRQASASYGFKLGITFQIIDDLLDYTGEVDKIGKNIGDDLTEGKVTLPLIYTLRHCLPSHRQTLQDIIKNQDYQQLELVINTMQATQAIDKTYQYAQQFAKQAEQSLQQLPNNIYTQALAQLIHFTLHRYY